jgi:hypothetical protein
LLVNFDRLNDNNVSFILNALSNFREYKSREDSTLSLFGRTIKLSPNTILSCLTTISPASIKLPRFTSLVRSQMRVVAFSVPNMIMWTQSMLYMHGFEDAGNKELTEKRNLEKSLRTCLPMPLTT